VTDGGPRGDRTLLVCDLGVMAYAEALELQRNIAARRISGDVVSDVLLLVEHPPVVTLGRSARAANLLAGPELLAARGVELFEVERGGDVTFHGPGQLVGYPIIDLEQHRKDLHWYLRALEESLIGALAAFGIEGGRDQRNTGVWVQGRKIASIGVHARGWVTWHGFALNVTTDLGYFDLIVPCGIQQVEMTSIARECAPRQTVVAAAAAAVVASFSRAFDLDPVWVDDEGRESLTTGPVQETVHATSSQS
jgi:lipoate-protein ligase B